MQRNTRAAPPPWAFTGLKPVHIRRETGVADSGGMSTLQHTTQPIHRTRLMLAVFIAGAATVLVIALIAASGSSVSSAPAPHLSKAQATHQLDSLNGARYGTAKPSTSARPHLTPQQQLNAVASERYLLTH